MCDVTLTETMMIIATHANGPEILDVKRLPGREYRSDIQRWIVPIRPGLSKVVEEVFGSQLAALIEEREAAFIESLKPAPVYPADLFSMPAQDAINRAVVFHLYDYHKGDLGKYVQVHGKAGE